MASVDMPHKDVPPPLELVKSRIEELLPPDAPARRSRRARPSWSTCAIRTASSRGTSRARSTCPPARAPAARTTTAYAEAVEEAAGGKDKR